MFLGFLQKSNTSWLSFLSKRSALDSNICISTIGTDATKHGYSSTSFGVITPNATLQGVDIFEYTWQEDGTFILSFGDGTEHLANIDSILVAHHSVPDGNIAIWDQATTSYRFTDSVLANYIIDGAYTEMCFYVELIPQDLIIYNFNNILSGSKV